MKVLIIGSGGREHALAWKISQSPLLAKLYAAPGNGGIADIAQTQSISAEDIPGLLAFAKKEAIDLTLVGPEAPLVEGIVDVFQAAGLRIFGPSKDAARLEGSKSFAKDCMTRFGVPTAPFRVFTDVNRAKHYVVETDLPVVIKADGLAGGKGVSVCDSSQEAVAALHAMMHEGAFGEAGKKVVIEAKLEGEEASLLALSDGETIIPLSSSQDHKRIYDNDRGPNTGGMGAYSPCPFLPDKELSQLADQVIRPVIEGLAREGCPYRGVLYAGLMLTQKGPMVLEYNCRFGDPETQSILPRLKSDLLPVLYEIAEGRMKNHRLEWDERACLSVVLASGGYPGSFDKGLPIRGIEFVSHKKDVMVFHSGTDRRPDGALITAGGRVLSVAALGESLRAAHDRVYEVIPGIEFERKVFRRDIGRRALEVHQ